MIEGFCDPGFAAVRAAFEANFAARGEVGASVAVARRGELVVDLWGGLADPETDRPWQHDTLVNIWSTTKGVTALAMAMLVDRGLLAYDEPVARYWPAFAAQGKGAITVAMLLSHQAGLCGFDEPIAIEQLYDAAGAADRLAEMAPLCEPGSSAGYHAITIGFLADALCRRVDGRSLATFVRDEFAEADLTIGLPADREHRAARILAPPALGTAALVTDLTPIQQAALLNPPLDPLLPNTTGWRQAEIPSANGFGTARGLALLYGRVSGGRPLVSETTLAEAASVRWAGRDAVLSHEARWAAGFLRNVGGLYGPNDRSFGHSGWGGAFAFADPDAELAIAYTMNRMGSDLVGDPRNRALVEAVYS